MGNNTMSKTVTLVSALALMVGLGLTTGAAIAQEKKALRFIPHSGLRITDPIMTTAYVTRNHGYMIYDTLFSVDDKFVARPQMVEKFEVSGDKLTYSFTLRDGLKFHDGAPVTSADVVASLKRWGTNDGMGQKLLAYTKELVAVNDKVFQIQLKEPYGLVIDSLAKPSSNVPFIMPKRMADMAANTAVTEEIGSGPFRMVKAEFQPGVKVVYEKNPDYKPRAEPASALAGGKVAKVDRIEWITMTDAQTATNALIKGEVDIWEQVAYDLLPELEKAKDVSVVDLNPAGLQYMLRPNWLQPPLDNPKIRQVIMQAVDQEDYLAAQIGNSKYYKACKAIFGCGTPLASDAGAPAKKPDLATLKKMLQDSGYKGERIVIMAPTDLLSIAQLPLVTAPLLRSIGFNIDLQSMDWQTLVGRRGKADPVDQGGWHIFHTAWYTADILNPIANAGVRGSGFGKGGWFGWSEDPTMEKLRDQYAAETDPAKQKALAEAVQKRAYEMVMFVPLGQYQQPSAHRKNISGLLATPAYALWNVEKK